MGDEKDFMEALTDEERAQIGDATEDELSTDGEDADAGDVAAAGADDEPKAEATSAPAEGDQAVIEEQAEPILPPFRAKAPENADEILGALAAEEESLVQKFEDGDITAREYREAINKVNDQRDEIKWATREAGLASKMQQQAEENAWIKEVEDFMTTTAVNITKSRAAMIAFDEMVKKVTADPENAKLSNRAQLDKAFRLYNEDMAAAGFNAQTQKPAAKSEPAPAPAQKAQRFVPPTLARVPASDIETVDGSKFTSLDRLAVMDPVAYEAAVAKMTEAERAQFESVA